MPFGTRPAFFSISVSLSQKEVTSVQDTFSTGLFAPLKWLGLSLVTFCHWACVTGFPALALSQSHSVLSLAIATILLLGRTAHLEGSRVYPLSMDRSAMVKTALDSRCKDSQARRTLLGRCTRFRPRSFRVGGGSRRILLRDFRSFFLLPTPNQEQGDHHSNQERLHAAIKLKRQSAVKLMEDSVPGPPGTLRRPRGEGQGLGCVRGKGLLLAPHQGAVLDTQIYCCTQP